MSRRRDEAGSALPLALAFVTVVAVGLGALLSLNEAGFRTTLAVRDQREVAYAVDGAVDGAINALRGDASLGREGGSCPTLSFPVNGRQVQVACEGLAGSGAATGGGGATPANTPSHAILLRAGPGEVGFRQESSSELRVSGPVFSNSSVAVAPNAVLAVDGAVVTRSGCTGTVNATPPCSAIGGAAYPAGDDPGWPRRSDAPPVPGPPRDLSSFVDRCITAGAVPQVFTLEPGWYDDARPLSALTGGGPCTGSLVWFKPGVYYFDFANSGSHLWSITGTGTNVVGGEPAGWSATAPRPVVPFPGGCRTEADGAADGVQLVFGGDSRVVVRDATFELCAKPTADEQQIAVYGVPSGSAPQATTALAPTTNPANSTPAFSAPRSAAYAIGEAPTRLTTDYAVTSAPAAATGTITVGGFPTTAIPAGSSIDSVRLRVAHQEAGEVQSLAATVTAGDGTTATVNDGNCSQAKLCNSTAYSDQSFDVTPTLGTLAKLTGVTVRYAATVAKNKTGTARLDGVELVVAYTAPAYRAQSGCLVAVPYTDEGASACGGSPAAFFQTAGSPTGVRINGTVYAPRAALDVELTNNSTQVFGRGVVARALRTTITASSSFAGAAITLPTVQPAQAADRVVRFTASVEGRARLVAVARFADNGGATPGAAVQLSQWVVRR